MEAQWSLKDVYWRGNSCKIITQNENGPCSLIALCNILLLRGELPITPPDRPIVTYTYLSELIADYLLSKPVDPSVDLGAALSTLPRTQYGLDVDVQFASYDGFSTSKRSGEDSGAGELALFKLCGVSLVHGWLADPSDSQSYEAVLQAASYNKATDMIVTGDEIAQGGVVKDRGVGELAQKIQAIKLSKSYGKMSADAEESGPSKWNEDESKLVHQALLVQQFLDSSSTQLTYNGLFVLAQSLQPGQLVALFRNSHVSVLYRRLPEEAAEGVPTLFTLATDSSFLLEDEIVWESLVDVDGASSEFFDGKFVKAKLRDGDYVGGRPEMSQPNEDADFALAMQIYEKDQQRAARRQRRGSSRQASQHQQRDPRFGSGPSVPTEVFTTMRYEPQANDGQDELVKKLLPVELRQKLNQAQPTTATTAAAPTESSTNPFQVSTELAPSTNPFLVYLQEGSSATQGGSTNSTHRLYKHIPLLSEHLKRLESSAETISQIYSSSWPQRRPLDEVAVLEEVETALDSFSGRDGTSVLGIRVAIKRDGKIVVGVRVLTPFPSSVATDGLAGRAMLPAVRFDVQPTRVRSMDMEAVVYNKTDVRGFYEAAKARVGADPSVLSGVRPDDGKCFDVILSNDEDGQPLVTETSIANVILQTGDRWVTPPTTAGMLNGLLRSYLVEHHIVQEAPLDVMELRSILERGEGKLFLANSLRGIWEAELVPNLAPPQQPKRNRFSQMVNPSSNSGPTPATMEQNVLEDLYGTANPKGNKGKSKNNGRDKCTVM